MLALLFFGFTGEARAEAKNKNLQKARFFFQGDCHIRIHNQQSGRVADVRYCDGYGALHDEAFDKIDAVFGFSTVEKGENISRRLIAFLDYFTDAMGSNPLIQMTSCYRSPVYNKNLRDRGGTVAKTSTHMDGMALDFTFAGMQAKEMWELMRSKNCCGAGYYHGNVVHLDSGRPRFWTTETSKVKTDASEHNRFIYLSTEYDRYHSGEMVRLFFTSMSDFGFGVPDEVQLIREGDPAGKKNRLALRMKVSSGEVLSVKGCQRVESRNSARFLYVDLPTKDFGEFRVQIRFCQKTAELMPDGVLSNPIEIMPGALN